MSSSFQLLIATGNARKADEVREFLENLPLVLRNLLDFSAIEPANETGKSYVKNAVLKASWYATQTGIYALADDSGLEVDALGEKPGLFSARYLNAKATDSERINRLLTELSSTRDDERTARFHCAVAIVDLKGYALNVAEGVCYGKIASEARGRNGFGYDPVFIPESYTETFEELTSQKKDRISHRARALEKTRIFLHELSSRE